MHYLDEGEGQPILMLHGNPTWSYFYRHLVLQLRSHARIIVPDHLGCGLSDVPSDRDYDYRLRSRVEDLSALLEHLQLQSGLTLIAHDWGGMIGMTYACQFPERFKRIVLMNTAAFLLPGGKRLPMALRLAKLPGLGSILVRGLNLFLKGTLRLGCLTHVIPGDIQRAYQMPYVSWRKRRAILRFVQDIPLTPRHPTYQLVQETASNLHRLQHLPMMLCWGMQDFVFDHHFLKEWEARFPQATVHRFEEASHLILEDVPHEVIPLIKQFVMVASAPRIQE